LAATEPAIAVASGRLRRYAAFMKYTVACLMVAVGVAGLGVFGGCSDDDDDSATSASSQSTSTGTGTGSGASGSGASSSSGTGASGGAGAAGGQGGEGTTGGAGGQGGGATGGGGGTGGAGMSNITATIESFEFWVNCQPIVSEDPVHGSFTAQYVNSGPDAGSATIVSAKLEMDNGVTTGEWEFDVSPASSGAVQAGQTLDVIHQKVAGTGTGTRAPCSFCNGQAAATWQLKLQWDVGGTNVVTAASTSEPLSCVF
jgi:hypothetical protein